MSAFWSCAACTFDNKPSDVKCAMCLKPRPAPTKVNLSMCEAKQFFGEFWDMQNALVRVYVFKRPVDEELFGPASLLAEHWGCLIEFAKKGGDGPTFKFTSEITTGSGLSSGSAKEVKLFNSATMDPDPLKKSAAVLWRMCSDPMPASSTTPFKPIARPGLLYYQAISREILSTTYHLGTRNCQHFVNQTLEWFHLPQHTQWTQTGQIAAVGGGLALLAGGVYLLNSLLAPTQSRNDRKTNTNTKAKTKTNTETKNKKTS